MEALREGAAPASPGLPRDRALVRSREHVALADLVLAGRLPEASAAMRRHLETVGEEKISGQAPRATQ